MSQYDILVATLYSTLFTILSYTKVKRRLYLVQNYETDFYPHGEFMRGIVEKTYNIPYNIEYITISKWCKAWLLEKYGHNSKFDSNGINLKYFEEHKKNLKK